MLQNEEFINEFIEEATVHVENIEMGLLKLSKQKEDDNLINEIFRAIHSTKGTAGFFGLKNIVDLSHSMENLFGEIRNKKIKINDELVDILLNSNDCLKWMVKNIEKSEMKDVSKYINSILALVSSSKEKNEKNDEKELIKDFIKDGHKLYRVKLRMNEDLGRKNISPIEYFKRIETIGNIIETYTDISDVEGLDTFNSSEVNFIFLFTTILNKDLIASTIEIPAENIVELDVNLKKSQLIDILKKIEKPLEEGKQVKEINSAILEENVRVKVSLLNDLLNLASEMVLGRNQLLRGLEGYKKKIPGITQVLQNIDHITTELQEKIMQTRMQTLSTVFNKFPKIIRELSKKTGKQVELKMMGTEVELDKSIIEALTDPLTHLIRNSVDHGIESSNIRTERGKPKTGTVFLKAYHEGGYVNIDITDDGGGIDVEKIKEKALSKGIVTKQELSLLEDGEVLKLIMKPGFSTADEVTDISGRGVGMDVVKTNIEKLGGTVEIMTTVKKGTTFRLILPLTLAIIHSLIVEVNKQKFALPHVNLQEMVRIKKEDKNIKIEKINGALILRLRGNLLPLVSLSEVLKIEKADRDEDKNIYRILVLKVGTKNFGLIVDSIHDEEEILVKPLPKYFSNCSCYSGVTIMGDGKVAMILDPEGIKNAACLKFIDRDNLKRR